VSILATLLYIKVFTLLVKIYQARRGIHGFTHKLPGRVHPD